MTNEELMQRCVDGELNDSERHDLIQELEQDAAQWKALACLYMEDQLFSQAISRQPSVVPREDAVSSTDRRNLTDSQASSHSSRIRRWFAHPVTSVALCLCVAFLSGMMLKGSSPSDSSNIAAVGMSSPVTATRAEFPEAMRNALDQMGYNRPDRNDLSLQKPSTTNRSPRVFSSSFRDEEGRRFLRLHAGDSSIVIPIDQIQVQFGSRYPGAE